MRVAILASTEHDIDWRGGETEVLRHGQPPISTSHSKVRSSVHDGPPNFLKARTFELTFPLDL